MDFLQLLLLFSIFMFNPFGKRARTKRAHPMEEAQIVAAVNEEEESNDEDDDEDDDNSGDDVEESYEPQGPWGPLQWDAIFNQFMVTRRIRIERTVNSNKCSSVYAQLVRRNWLGLCTLDVPCYSEVVKWFFASGIRNGRNSIVATVRGVQVCVSPSIIAQVIGAPRVGNSTYPVVPEAFEGKEGKKLIRKIAKELTGGKYESFANLAQGDLTDVYKILHLLVSHSFLPVGRNSTTSWDRCVFMYCVMKGYDIDLPQVIFDYILTFLSVLRKKPDQLPFGTLVSAICISAGVVVDATDLIIPKEQPVGIKNPKSRPVGHSGESSSRGASGSGVIHEAWMDQPPSITPMSACTSVSDLAGAMSQFKLEYTDMSNYQNRYLAAIFDRLPHDDSQHGHL